MAEKQPLTVEEEISETSSMSIQPPISDGNSSIRLTTTLLNGSNYLAWSRAIIIALEGKGKEGYIDGSIQSPEKKDPNYPNWKMNDRQILSGLLNSMQPEISNLFFLSDSSLNLWNSVREMFGQQNNYSHVFKLKQEITQIRQGEKSVTEILGAIKGKFDELNLYMPPTTDLHTIQLRNEQEKTFAFLAALNPSYEAVRSQILLAPTLPPFASVAAQVQREESRRKTMMPEVKHVEEERLAMAVDRSFTGKPNFNNGQTNTSRGRGNSSEKCDHCHRNGHTKDRCWFLYPHLRPKKKKEKNGGAGGISHAATAQASNSGQEASGSGSFLLQQIGQLIQAFSANSNTGQEVSNDHHRSAGESCRTSNWEQGTALKNENSSKIDLEIDQNNSACSKPKQISSSDPALIKYTDAPDFF